MSTKWMSIDELELWPGNYRLGDVAAIRRSLSRFGFNGALRIRGGTVMAGNHVLRAIREIREERQAPPFGVRIEDGAWLVQTVSLEHLTEEEAVAFAIADNRTSDLASNDEASLAELLKGLEAPLIDVLSFQEKELVRLLRSGPGEPIDAPPEDPQAIPPADIRVKPGQLWRLGEHRLLCGDSTNMDAVAALMQGEQAALVSTDPPYVIDYTGSDRPSDGKDWSNMYHETEILDFDAFYKEWMGAALANARPNAAWFCWHADVRAPELRAIWKDMGLLYHQQIIWSKPTSTMTYSLYRWAHEPCLFGWLQGNKPALDGVESLSTTIIWSIDWEGKSRLVGNEHPTQKPVEIFARPMRIHTRPGDICFEPFSGSGSQLIAGEQEGRRVRAIELEPAFCEVGIRRWEAATGQTAELLEENAWTAPA